MKYERKTYGRKGICFREGKDSIFIKNREIMENNLKKEKYTTDELLELLFNNKY
jgi:uncharacterized membrane protein YcaP (DUF421 family)